MSGPSVFVYSGGRPTYLNAPLPWPRFVVDPGIGSGCGGGCGGTLTYEAIYDTQPNVRTVISFLATNVAQVSLHTFRREGENDRVRMRDDPLAQCLARPWPGVTQYRLMETLVSDVAIYGQAFWLKVALPDDRLGLLRVPPNRLIRIEYSDTTSMPEWFEFARTNGAAPLRVSRSRVCWFRQYSPRGDIGSSTLDALRLLLEEDIEAARYRSQLWANGARIGGVLSRPADAPEWNDATKQRFAAEWKAWYSGDIGSEAGGTPILEDGMTYAAAQGFTAEQAQYLEARKLSMVQVAAAYHVPPPMVGVLDNANFSNVREFHRSLYQDTLGPWFRMIEQEIDAELIPEFADTDGLYVEFNVAEKLRGSFEEQARALQVSVGAPYMTRSEARARMNLPERSDADGLVVPLNVATSEPGEGVPEPTPGAASRTNGHKAPQPA